MIDVFRFLFTHSFKNRLKRRLARLREPRYLVPFLVSLLWFGSMVFRPILRGRMHYFGWPAMQPDVRDAIVFVAGLAIFVWVALLWILPSKRAALQFSPAETHFLFTAPVTRRQILHYKLLQAQVGILFGAGVSAFFSGARLWQMQGWSRLAGLWLFFAVMYLHGIGASFVRTDFIDRGWSVVRRRGLTIAVVLVFVVAVVLGAREAWTGIVNSAGALFDKNGDISLDGVDALSRALAPAGKSGLVGVLLWPFLVLPRLILATTPAEFGRYAASGLVILLLHYLWVVRSDAAFEEASVELAEKTAERRATRRETVRRGGPLVKKATRFPWQLKPKGPPETAILWKNLVNLSRITPFRALFALGLFILAMLGWAIQLAAKSSDALWVIAAMLLAGIAGFTSAFGPLFVRNDLREDLFRIDSIKTFPVAGHAIVWGEVLGAWVPLAAIQCIALALASGAYGFAGAPGVEEVSGAWVCAIGAAALLLLPGLSLAAVALQNGLVLLFPAWVALGHGRARGFEASGQRILTLVGTMFMLTLFALPAIASGAAVAWALSRPLGPMCLLVGGAIASGWIVFEVVLGCRFMGKVLDRIDPSTAGIEAQED